MPRPETNNICSSVNRIVTPFYTPWLGDHKQPQQPLVVPLYTYKRRSLNAHRRTRGRQRTRIKFILQPSSREWARTSTPPPCRSCTRGGFLPAGPPPCSPCGPAVVVGSEDKRGLVSGAIFARRVGGCAGKTATEQQLGGPPGRTSAGTRLKHQYMIQHLFTLQRGDETAVLLSSRRYKYIQK